MFRSSNSWAKTAESNDNSGPTHKLPFNESKAKVLTITGKRLASKINDELIVTVEDNRPVNVKSATLLGLPVDSSLSFDCYVENLCKKLASQEVAFRVPRGRDPFG